MGVMFRGAEESRGDKPQQLVAAEIRAGAQLMGLAPAAHAELLKGCMVSATLWGAQLPWTHVPPSQDQMHPSKIPGIWCGSLHGEAVCPRQQSHGQRRSLMLPPLPPMGSGSSAASPAPSRHCRQPHHTTTPFAQAVQCLWLCLALQKDGMKGRKGGCHDESLSQCCW